MANEKHDPWALLREAREAVEWDFDWSEHSQASDRKVALDLLSRIDAALAAHDAVPPSEVDWKARCCVLEKALRAACVPGCSHEGESDYTIRDEAYHAGWIALGDARCGFCGKNHAAIAAARGMR